MKPEAGIVERLRIAHPNSAQRIAGSNILLEAASLIERQSRALVEARGELDTLSQAVKAAGEAGYFVNWSPAYRRAQKQIKAITAALTEKDE